MKHFQKALSADVTKEQALKLHELGYEGFGTYWIAPDGEVKLGEREGYIPIPKTEDVLKWFNNTGYYSAYLNESDKDGKFSYLLKTPVGEQFTEDFNNYFDASKSLIDKLIEMYSFDL